MIEITVKVPKDVRDIVTAAGETIYIEALNQVAFKRISYLQKQLEAFEKEIRIYKRKYNKSFEDFLQDVPDTIEGHDDWIEWTYLVKAADELSKKIEKLTLLKGQ
jgi:acyl-[acyl carrier protein]--UDP-N-acetylglucosamine O-acyltransferase